MTGAFGTQPQCLIGLALRLGAVGSATVREHPAERDSFAAKPGHGSDQEAERGGLFSSGKTSSLVIHVASSMATWASL